MSFGFFIGRANALPGQRGFTLVELAIALAVVGLLLGASLIPLRALDEARQLEDEHRRLEAARDAIVGYALRHRTRARTIQFVFLQNPIGDALPAGFRREFRLPAGRPYLPCPDWDGDGFEDRYPANEFPQGMEVKPDLTVTAGLQVYAAQLTEFSFTWVEHVPEPYAAERSRPYGECMTTRGSVPWRTLGVSPADGWGNRHTYFVDPVFSNAIFGFDRQTVADIYEPRIPEVPWPVSYVPRNLLTPAWSFRPARRALRYFHFIPYGIEDLPCPAIICRGGQAGNCANHSHEYSLEYDLQSCGVGDPDTVALKAGVVAPAGGISNGRHFYPAGSVTDGLPFVLVSHGPNGNFAVKHWASLSRPVDIYGAPAPICDLFAAEVLLPAAFLRPHPIYTVRPNNRALVYEAINGVRKSSSNDHCPLVERWNTDPSPNFNPSFFVWEPPGLGEPLGTRDASGFDDLLLWTTREDLSLAMKGDIPPLPRMTAPLLIR